MADRYWVGVDGNWHDDDNWATTSGGAGGAGVPTDVDDVFIDGNGYTLCYPTEDIECNDLSLLSGMTESLLIDASAVINGDFLIEDGYFGPTGGPDHTIEFKGNWLNTGGSFSVGTGTGKDPECIFSGQSKTYNLNQTGAASFQHVLVSGEVIFSGTRLGVMNISQDLSITGVMTVNANGLTTCDVDLDGVNAGFGTFTGKLEGTGRLWWRFREGYEIPTTGIIEIRYFRIRGYPGQVSGAIDQDLDVDGWNSVNEDWTHEGASPWIETDDGDTSRITLPAETSSQGLYDEEYTVANMPVHDPPYDSVATTTVKVHLISKLVAGTGGTATFVTVKAYLWDGAAWQDGGTAFIIGTTYADRACTTSLHASIDTLAKLDGMKLKLEVDTVAGGGADKGSIAITQAYIEVVGTGYWDPVFEVAPRVWDTPCEVEIEYTDDKQTFRFEGGNQHYFGNQLTILCDEAGVDEALFDCDYYTAQMWVHSTFDIYKDAFPSAVFTIKFGNGTHVFRGSVDFYFSYASGSATQLVVDPGEGTIILYPRGRTLIPL